MGRICSHFIFWILAFLGLLFPLCTYANGEFLFKKIVFFGDSLTDNGNLYSYDFGYLPKSPPYYKGQFCNHLVWSERVAKYFKNENIKVDNYAVGGETVLVQNPFQGYMPLTFSTSVNDYLLRSILSDKSEVLFVIWIAANDYTHGIKDIEKVTSDVNSKLKFSIEDLIASGGKNFLIMNLPDLGKSPAASEQGISENLTAITKLHNAKLAISVAELQKSYKGMNIQLFDVYSLMNGIYVNLDEANKKYNVHLVNSTKSCWNGGYTLRKAEIEDEEKLQKQLDEQVNLQIKTEKYKPITRDHLQTSGFAKYVLATPSLREAYLVGVNRDRGFIPCSNPDEYIFWDKVHPTAVMHKILSQEVIQFLQNNYVKK